MPDLIDLDDLAADEARIEALADKGVDLHYALGLFAALHTGPEIVQPATWLELVVEDRTFTDFEDAQAGISTLMAVYNGVAQSFREGDAAAGCPPPDDHDAVASFCAGYVDGAKLQPEWRRDEKGSALLLPFSGDTPELPKLLRVCYEHWRARRERRCLH